MAWRRRIIAAALPLAFALAAPGQDDAGKKPKGKKPGPGDMALDANDDKAMAGKGDKGDPNDAAPKPGKGKAAKGKGAKAADEPGSDDPAYGKKLAQLKQQVQRDFKKSKKPMIYVYMLTEERHQLEEVPPKEGFGTRPALGFDVVHESVCKLTEDAEEAADDAYKFVSEHPPFEKKAKREKGKKGMALDIGAPPRPRREYAKLGAFPKTKAGEAEAAARKEEAERQILDVQNQEKAARDAKKKG